ncbi:MAG: Glu-tRNA(Gln) amidotransferase subunit GatE [Bacteroidota bacterium]|nr:Glu-tRNA(Gln) amidotransferase subunit GatE [Bacteroidota bacterium]
MKQKFDPKKNYEATKNAVGYVPRKQATQKTYDDLGFISGLETHQQLLTKEKLFCRCPAGCFHDSEDFDAEIIRHMRPTLSELGEYDGTALMEFKTKKEIVYRVKNRTTCTYEVDDTPPFPLNREALEKAIEVALSGKMSIVGEVHITRKQYLDGSIPTGFQRTAIIGVEGELQLKNKKIRLIQMSLEEDSCREVSDIKHRRIYKTDRLGMPLIETVTYPDMVNPDEVKEAANYIRFLNRSTGNVRTGIGSTREDVNVSCKGGTRIEIKGVAHIKWIPELTHNECFRQWALLKIKEQLNSKTDANKWAIKVVDIDPNSFKFKYAPLNAAKTNKDRIVAINLPYFKGILSHFTQPGKMFADDFSERLKVIACIEKPNMVHSEQFEQNISEEDFTKIRSLLKAKDEDAQVIIWSPEADLKTAIEVIEERCKMAFTEIPKETRKSFGNGTTIFERVLPGADRMYPDTDSAPIPLENDYLDKLAQNMPVPVYERFNQLKKWGIPEDTYTYILKKNFVPIIEKIINELKFNPVLVGTTFCHKLKFIEGQSKPASEFNFDKIYDLFKYVKDNDLDNAIIKKMLFIMYEHPKMDFDSILTTIGFKKVDQKNLITQINFLKEKFKEIQVSGDDLDGIATSWIMGQLRKTAIGNISFKDLRNIIEKEL